MSKILEYRDVEVHFARVSPFLRRTLGHVRAVDGVDLELAAGETLGLVGESGSGKSTLGRLALGLVDPTAGQVLIRGEDLASMNREARRAVRRDVQFVFQDPYSSLDPFSSVGDSIAEPLRTHGLVEGSEGRRARVVELLGKVGLPAAAADRYPRQFSGGQLQRIAIARALAVEPRLIVLDEPVSSLDVSTQAEVVNLLKDLQRETGVAYLFIAHDLAVVNHLATWIAVLYLGKVVEYGEAQDVVESPRHPYTQALLSAVPGVDDSGGGRIVLDGELPSPTVAISGCAFHTRCPHVMDICRTAPPPLIEAGSSLATCHLHTGGPKLAGRSVDELTVPAAK